MKFTEEKLERAFSELLGQEEMSSFRTEYLTTRYATWQCNGFGNRQEVAGDDI